MRLVFLGAPGAGKGTQAERLAASLAIPHISTGDILRETAKRKSPLARKVRLLLKSGSLIPDRLMTSILLERISKRDAAKGYILDGFPRTLRQAQSLEEALSKRKEELSGVIYLDLPGKVAVERLSGRRTCETCGKNFHTKFHPPKKQGICDSCGSHLIQRGDDSEQTVKNRMRVYKKQTSELISFYKKKKILYTIDGSKRKEDVAKEIYSTVSTLPLNKKERGSHL
jgi:adenylate kinase